MGDADVEALEAEFARHGTRTVSVRGEFGLNTTAEVDWNDECDVLVAGSGAGGVTGAYTAAREGLDVILVEATEMFGGTTAYSGGGGMWFPANPVLLRAGTDDTVEDALEYYTAVVGDRTPRALQETYVRSGAPLIEYLEADEKLKFSVLPWPDYFGKAPKARADGMRHIAAKPLKVAAAPDLKELIRGPLDSDRLGAPRPDDYFVGGRALIARFLTATGSTRLLDPTEHRTRRTGRRGRPGRRRGRRVERHPAGDPHPTRCAAGGRRLREQRRTSRAVRRAGGIAGHHGPVGKSGSGAPGRNRGRRRHRPDGSGVVVARPDPSRRPLGVLASGSPGASSSIKTASGSSTNRRPTTASAAKSSPRWPTVRSRCRTG